MNRVEGKARLAVLISGGGRTLANLLSESEAGRLPAIVSLVIASKPSPILQSVKASGIAVEVIPGEIDSATLLGLLREHMIDWVVLAGYVHLLRIPQEYQGRVVNIHPSLLPRHGGPGMYGSRVHQAVLKAGDRQSGCTVHLCDDRYDNGRIILQRTCPVLPGDTVETLANRVFELEKVAYPEALRQLMMEQ